MDDMGTGETEATEPEEAGWGFGYTGIFRGAPKRIEYWRQSYESAVDAYRLHGVVEELQSVRRRLCHKIIHLVSYVPETDRDHDALMTAHAMLHRMSVEVPEVPWGETFETCMAKYISWGVAGGRRRFEEGCVSVRSTAPRIGLGTGLAVRVCLTRRYYDSAVIWYLATGDAEPLVDARRLALGLMSFHLEQSARSPREIAVFREAGAFLVRLGREFPQVRWPDDRKARLERLIVWAEAGGQQFCDDSTE